jgi:hypothetical protein
MGEMEWGAAPHLCSRMIRTIHTAGRGSQVAVAVLLAKGEGREAPCLDCDSPRSAIVVESRVGLKIYSVSTPFRTPAAGVEMSTMLEDDCRC